MSRFIITMLLAVLIMLALAAGVVLPMVEVLARAANR